MPGGAPSPVILAYHGIAEVDPRHDPVRLFVRPDALRRQRLRVDRVIRLRTALRLRGDGMRDA